MNNEISSEEFTEEKVQDVFRGDIIGREIFFFPSIPSTNDRAVETGLRSQNPDGIVIVADMQTHGRGRLGRSWISPAGVNLYFTVLLSPPCTAEEASVITLAAPVAVVSAIRSHTGLPARIKWPNDIMVNERKTGGILIEMKSGPDNRHFIALGTGINVNMPLHALPAEIRASSTSLKSEKGEPVNRLLLLRAVLSELEKYYKFLLHGNKRVFIREWIRLNSTIGKHVTVRTRDRTIGGIAERISDKGELLMRLSSGKIEIIRAGDVTIQRQGPGDQGA